MSALRRIPFWVQIVAGLVLGVLLGLVARVYSVDWLTTGLDTVGGVFVGLLKAAVPPLVFVAVVVSIANLRQVANAARLAVQTLLWFMITSLIAVAIGLTLGLLTNPGSSAEVSAAEAGAYEGSTGTWLGGTRQPATIRSRNFSFVGRASIGQGPPASGIWVPSRCAMPQIISHSSSNPGGGAISASA